MYNFNGLGLVEIKRVLHTRSSFLGFNFEQYDNEQFEHSRN